MADTYWHTQLANFEPTVFADLSGRSSSARSSLSDFYSAQQVTNVPKNGESIVRCLGACAKVLALYMGESDICIDFLSKPNKFASTCQKEEVLPIRIRFESPNTNNEIVSQIQHDLAQAQQYGPPSQNIVKEILGGTDTIWTTVLMLIRDESIRDDISMIKYDGQYDFIVEVFAQHSEEQQTRIVSKIHARRSHVLHDDLAYILSAFNEALLYLHSKPSSRFLSWNSETSLKRSLSNPNPEAADSRGCQLVHTAFERHVSSIPDEVALDFLEDDYTRTQWTYTRLNSIANRIASKLIEDYGVQLEDPIPICVPKGPAFYACILAVLKAGGAFTPFAASPEDRKRYMLKELGSRIVLYTQGQDMSWVSGTATMNVTPLIEENQSTNLACTSNLKINISPSNLCYQMYTSGSTGKPKAVSLEHTHAVQTACATRDLVPWKRESRLLQQAGVSFDMCYFETFFAWTVGICLCSTSDNLIYNSLSEVVNELDISLLGLTPSVALTLDPASVPNLEWLYCIGEALPQSLVDRWEGRLVNSYGPTEAAQMVTLFPAHHDVKSTVIGIPFPNTSFVVLQKDSIELVPILGVGELCIGGHQVARGYYKNPERTQQSFIMFEHERLYRTGDLVRMLGNGKFEFIGREDDQVKIRGQRVELGEIENALRGSHQAVKRVCVQILKVSDKSKSQLVAFLVLGDGQRERYSDEVRSAAETHLTKSLPAYMVPKLFLFLDRIPLSAAGKVDKRALTKLLRESDEMQSSSQLDATEGNLATSQVLQQAYSDCCGVPPGQISLDITIYQLGIDSINAIQIAHKLRQQGFRIQASDILKYPTIRQMRSILDESATISQRHQEEQIKMFNYDQFDQIHRREIIEKHGISGTRIASVRPASSLQSSMIMQSSRSSRGAYFNHLTYQMPDNVNKQRFLSAWDALVSNHDILRSGFVHLQNARFPIAMVTYYARSVSLPVTAAVDEYIDLGSWRSKFVVTTMQQPDLTPWQVLVAWKQNRFYFSAHHALYDAQVLEILMRDLALAYDGQGLPRAPPLEPHLDSLLMYAEKIPEGPSKFWKKFGSKAVASKFPLLHPLFETSRDTHLARRPSPISLLDLEKGCQASGITMQAAAQVAWGLLLAAMTGERIATFGTVLSGRVSEYSENVCFPMITTVPTVVDSQLPYADLAHDMVKFNADIHQNQFVPLAKIQKLMGNAIEILFDTIFTFQKRSHTQVVTTTEFCYLENSLTIQYPVSLELEPLNGELQCSLFYWENYMYPEQASLLVDQFHFLLQKIIFEGNSASPPTATDADRHLFSIMPAKQEYLPSACSLLHHSVEMAAKASPQNRALEFATALDQLHGDSRIWTYQQLDEEGNRVANFLRKFGVSQGSLVAFCLNKCPEAAFIMLGISKAGCGFLALDPGAPKERQKFIFEDSRASVLLAKGSLADSLQDSIGDKVIDIERDGFADCSPSSVQLHRAIDPQETAYCLYTSGTTGTPKGCLVTHENVIQVFKCFEKLYAHSDQSRWLQFASYHFDVSVMEHFWSWFVGMTVVKADRDLVLQDLAGTISSLEITHIDLTPSLARLLGPTEVPSLAKGVFVTGGEMLRKDIIETWGESGAIHNAYGPTEATIGVAMYQHVPTNGRPGNIGQPFDVVGVLIVDPTDPNRPVLRGGVGELLVTGKLVAKGYLQREELTMERFIEVAGQKCYRTGDLARILSDGSIEFVGRADDQVKLRGQRLEIGEINSVIKQQDKRVDDVSTLVLKHPKQQKEQLISFVCLSNNKMQQSALCIDGTDKNASIISDLRAACLAKLPGYMVPTHVLPISQMPLSPNNKVDNKRLKELYDSLEPSVLQDLQSIATKTKDPADAEMVRRISEVLSKSLGIDPSHILPESGLFELGMDSISVINLSRALKAADFQAAGPAMIMKCSNISELARALTNTKTEVRDGSVQAALQKISAFRHRHMTLLASKISTAHGDVEVVMPCTPLQAGIISRSLDSNHGLYFSAFSFDLDDTINRTILKSACRRVCNRVQVLRTKFFPTEDGYIQVVFTDSELPWLEQQLATSGSLDDHLQKAHRDWWSRNQDEISRPFEFVLTETQAGLVLTLHIFHALYDGNSLPLIMDAITSEYHGSETVMYGPKFSDALPYGPLREVEGAKDFWTGQLSMLEYIPPSGLRPLSQTSSRQHTNVLHRFQGVHGLENCRRRLGVTHQALMQACWTVLLQDVMSGPLVLGIIISGRSIDFDDADGVIGPLFNTIPFLLTVTKEDTWKDVITRCHQFNKNALTHQHTPLRDIQRWVRKNSPSGSLLETLFVFQKESEPKTSHRAPWKLREETFEADYPLSLEVEQTVDGAFNLTLACQAHMSNDKASKSLLQRFEEMIVKVVANPDSLVADTITNDITTKSIESCNGHGSEKDSQQVEPDLNSNQSDMVASSETMQVVRQELATLAAVSVDNVSANASMFEMGLDSIDAVKLSSRLRKATGVQLPVNQIMKLLTIHKIGLAIEDRKGSTQQVAQVVDLDNISRRIERALNESGVDTSAVEKVLPCTPLQEGMVADMLNSNFQRYLNFDVLKLHEQTDANLLMAAWTKAIEMFQILRSRFVQVTDPQVDFTIAQIVVRPAIAQVQEITMPVEKGFAEVYSHIRSDIKATFDCHPASRVTLIQDSERSEMKYLVLTLPHSMYDGRALALLHDAVDKLYHRETIDVLPYEPALSRILNSSGESSSDFWRQNLSGTKVTLFPKQSEHQNSTNRVQKVSTVPVAKIRAFSKQNNVSIAALCQTAWSVVLAFWTKQLDVTFAQVLSGRTDEVTSEVVFPTMNTVISRAVVHGTKVQMVRYVQDNLNAVSEHQHFPLRKAMTFATGSQKKSILNSLFIFQKTALEASHNRQKLYDSVDSASNVEYPVCIEAEVVDQNLTWRAACDGSFLDNDGIRRLFDHLDLVTDDIVTHPLDPVAEYSDEKIQLCNLPFVTAKSEQPQDRSEIERPFDDPGYSAASREWAAMEQTIREVVADVAKLDVEEIQRQSSLLELGLDSISTIKVSSLLRKQGIRASVHDLLSAGSIQKIAECCEGQQYSAPISKATDIPLAVPKESTEKNPKHASLADVHHEDLLSAHRIKLEEVEMILPTTAGQVLLLSRWQNEGVYYSSLDFSAIRCHNVSLLERAWTRVVQQHPMLRTVFIATGKSTIPVIQVVLKSQQPRFVELDPTSDLDQVANTLVHQDSTSLSAPCALFAKKADDDHVDLALKISHALYDGFSLKMLISSLQESVNDASLKQLNSPESFSTNLADVALLDSRRRFWTEYLANVETMPLSLTGSQAAEASARHIHVVRADVLPDLSRLRAYARRNRVSLQSLLLAAYSVIHALRLCRTRPDGFVVADVLVGIFMANRNFDSAEDLAAPTLGFAPVRVRKPLAKPLIEVARGIQDDLKELSEDNRGQVGLWELQEWLGDHLQVDVWVNILRQWLPDLSHSDDNGREQQIQVVTGEKSEDIDRSYKVTRQDEDPSNGLFMKDNQVRRCYDYPMMDVEATIKDDNLDIGIQARSNLVDFDGARQMIQEIAARLNDLSNETEGEEEEEANGHVGSQ